MKADPAAQLRLLDVQKLDTAITQLEHRIKTLPEHTLVQGLVARRNALGERYVAAQTALSDAETAQATCEADLEPVRLRLQRDQERASAGHVSDARALTSLLDEIEHLKKRILDLEDLELEAMERLEAAVATRDGILAEKADLDAEAREVVDRRDAQVRDLTAERDEHVAARAQVAGGVPQPLLDLYERVRAKNGGSGAGALQGRRHTACGLEATAADYDRYVAAAADEVLRCEECDAILVRLPETDPTRR